MARIRLYGMGHYSKTVVEVVPLQWDADQEGLSVRQVDQAADIVVV